MHQPEACSSRASHHAWNLYAGNRQLSYQFFRMLANIRIMEPPMSLTTKQRKALKESAHHLKPVIRVGQKGLTENLLQETSRALDTHELIKVHIARDDREVRQQCAEELALHCEAELVGRIGKVCILYRKRAET